MESEFAMTDPISNARPAAPGGAQRAATDKTERKADNPLMAKDGPVAPPVEARRAPGADEVVLSNVMQKAHDAPGYDQTKVESIKKSHQRWAVSPGPASHRGELQRAGEVDPWMTR